MPRKLPIGRHDPNEMPFEVFEADTRLATFHYVEDAAMFLAACGMQDDREIRYYKPGPQPRYEEREDGQPPRQTGDGLVVWREGTEKQSAWDAYDYVADTAWQRIRQARSVTK